MAAPKAKTHIERMGFVDADIKNPTHDDLIAAFVPNIEWLLNSLYKPSIPSVLSDWSIKYKTEVPIADGRFVIGFIDMTVAAQRQLLCKECEHAEQGLRYEEYQRSNHSCKEHEYNWRASIQEQAANKRTSETCKLCNAMRTGKCSIHSPNILKLDYYINLAIEFKTSKITAGEVLRQMNTYRHYTSSTSYVLVTYGPCPHKPLIWNEKIAIIEFVNNRWFMNWKSDLYDIYEDDVLE